MLTHQDYENIRKIIDEALLQLPEKLRPMVRQEIERHCEIEPPPPLALRTFGPIMPLTGDPTPVLPIGDEHGRPVNPICGHCGEVACICAELRRHD